VIDKLDASGAAFSARRIPRETEASSSTTIARGDDALSCPPDRLERLITPDIRAHRRGGTHLTDYR